jgi:hypothetical protein
MITALKQTEGHYEVQEVEFGKVYRWSSRHLKIECECGEKLLLSTSSLAACPHCGADHTAILRGTLNASRSSRDRALHPWRYDEAQSLQESGLPY